MKINKTFFNEIEPILIQIKEKIGNDFVVFGSAPLYLLGVVDYNKKINDLDIAVKDKGIIPKEAKESTFQKDPDQKLYKIIINNMEIDIGTCWKGQEDYFYKLFEDPIEINGFKFVNLKITEEWKKVMVDKYDREKDKIHVEKIKNYKIKTGF